MITLGKNNLGNPLQYASITVISLPCKSQRISYIARKTGKDNSNKREKYS
jgi:hypothetical protein